MSRPPEPPKSYVSVFPIRPPPAELAVKQWNNVAAIDGAACRAELAADGFRFTSVRDVPAPDKQGCGVPHGVVVSRGPSGIAYVPPILVDCGFARELVDVERIVQEEASRELGAPIARIRHLGTYACRHRRGRWGDAISEHAFANALDIAAFEPKKGKPAVVLRDYELGKEDDLGPRTRFLRAVFARLRGETDLSFVLGPPFNAEHRDHFHIDRGYRFWLDVPQPPQEGAP